jgi:hypothetical protein
MPPLNSPSICDNVCRKFFFAGCCLVVAPVPFFSAELPDSFCEAFDVLHQALDMDKADAFLRTRPFEMDAFHTRVNRSEKLSSAQSCKSCRTRDAYILRSHTLNGLDVLKRRETRTLGCANVRHVGRFTQSQNGYHDTL